MAILVGYNESKIALQKWQGKESQLSDNPVWAWRRLVATVGSNLLQDPRVGFEARNPKLMHVGHDMYPGTKYALGLANTFLISNQVLPAMGLKRGFPAGNQNDLIRFRKRPPMDMKLSE